MLELNKTEIDAKIYGESYKLRLPTVREAQHYGKVAKDLDKDDVAGMIDAAIDLLDSCGLPKKVSEQMTVDHMMQVVGVLVPSEKK